MSDDVKTTKVCYTCKKEKLFEDFAKKIKNKDGKSHNCKECQKQKDRFYKQRRAEKGKQKFDENYYASVSENRKTCSKCNKEKSCKDFPKDKRTNDGLYYFCLECYAERKRATDKKLIISHSKWCDVEYYNQTKYNKKECTRCLNQLYCKNFYKDIKSSDGYDHVCSFCRREEYPEKWQKYKSANTQNKLKLKNKRKSKNVCISCGEEKIKYSKYYCKHHYIGSLVRNAIGSSSGDKICIMAKKFDNNSYCPYTKEKLVLGLNASLDHIKPSSRFPELESDINNLEWVSQKANFSKQDMTKEEFLEFCKLIIKNNQQ